VEDLPRNISPASIVGLVENKIQNVKLKNIHIVYPGEGNPLYAKRGLTAVELDGVPEMRDAYPEFSQFKELPAWGFYIRHAEGISYENVTFTAKKKDYRPSIVLDDVQGASFTGLVINEPESAGKQAIFDEQIGVGAILEAMATVNAAQRFSKESIAGWFKADLLPLLVNAIKVKLPSISQDKIDSICDGYLRDFQLLAAREVMLSNEVKIKLEKAMMLLEDGYENPVSEKISEKLSAAGSKVVEDVL
jgi:hypothetical protein